MLVQEGAEMQAWYIHTPWSRSLTLLSAICRYGLPAAHSSIWGPSDVHLLPAHICPAECPLWEGHADPPKAAPGYPLVKGGPLPATLLHAESTG